MEAWKKQVGWVSKFRSSGLDTLSGDMLDIEAEKLKKQLNDHLCFRKIKFGDTNLRFGEYLNL